MSSGEEGIGSPFRVESGDTERRAERRAAFIELIGWSFVAWKRRVVVFVLKRRVRVEGLGFVIAS